jgi:hypothetical protein
MRKLSFNEESELYADLCNVICRDQLGIPEDDPFSHTSDAAREVASEIMEVLTRHDLIGRDEDYDRQFASHAEKIRAYEAEKRLQQGT